MQPNKFNEYLTSRNESCRAFSLRSGVAQNTVARLLTGQRVRMDVVKKVVRATKKEIMREDLNVYTKADDGSEESNQAND